MVGPLEENRNILHKSDFVGARGNCVCVRVRVCVSMGVCACVDVITPRRVCTSGVKQLVLSVIRPLLLSSVIKKIEKSL